MKTMLIVAALLLPLSINHRPIKQYFVKADKEVWLYAEPWNADGNKEYLFLKEAKVKGIWEESHIEIEVQVAGLLSYWYVHRDDVRIYKRKIYDPFPTIKVLRDWGPVPELIFQDSLTQFDDLIEQR